MELNKIKDDIYYIAGAVNLGLVVKGREALLIDAALDDSASRKVRRLLEEAGLTLKALVITHAHADHYGGAAYLAKATGAKVFAAMMEKSVMEVPLLEPVYLFGGAYPPAALRTKFFNAPPVAVDGVVRPGPGSIEGFSLEIVDLKGHSLGQIGVACDGVLFCADAVFGQETVVKHGVPLNADIRATLETFERLRTSRYEYYLPGHGELAREISSLVAVNENVVRGIIDRLIAVCETPRSMEDIIAAVGDSAGLEIKNTGAYYLTHLTVLAYVGYLLDEKRLAADYAGNRQVFYRI
ncbi:MAG TPA: MBL fold metallo-hydrolase [Selenomonadales bacterium]|nr:MBL fold metallo-hydrolase [Selenomonadales bacterium]